MRKAYDLLRAEKEKADRRIVELEAQIAAMFDRAEIEVNARKAAEARCQQLEEKLDNALCDLARLYGFAKTMVSGRQVPPSLHSMLDKVHTLLRKGE